VTTAVGQALAVARELLGDRVEVDRPLAPLTTYRVGGPAALFVDVREVDDLVRVARARARTGLPLLVIGRGSNLLVADEGFAGIVVSIAGFGDSIAIPAPDADGSVVVTAGGGVALPVLARRTAAAGVTGFEWAVGVPGSVGGAVRMNAGGHGSDIAASLIDAVVVDLDRDPDQHPDEPFAPLPVTMPRGRARTAVPGLGPHRCHGGADGPVLAARR
jgi:UDP-N-acetylmuramate dehydrogenase